MIQVDELQDVRALVEGDDDPDSDTLVHARSVLNEAIATERGGQPGRQRYPRRALSPHRRWLVIPTGIAAAIIILLTVILPEGNTDLGMQISYANTVPASAQPHFLNQAVSFGYLPSGFQLYGDTVLNKVTRPPQFRQSIQFTKSSSEGLERIYVSIQQSPNLFKGHPPALRSGPYQTVTLTTIHGHQGEVIAAIPPTPSAAPTNDCFPPRPTAVPTAPGLISLQWQERPGVAIDVTGTGVAVNELLRVADGLVYHPSIGDCLAGARIISHEGACTPGATSSPPPDVPKVAPGGHEIASGPADGKPWILSASIEPHSSWYQFNWGSQGWGSCTGGRSSLIPELDVQTSLTGQRFATGYVPAWVTSVGATAGATAVSQPVLPKSLHGVAFFALYLGKFNGVCNNLCRGPVTVVFFRGATKAASVTVSQDLGFGGFSMSGHTKGP